MECPTTTGSCSLCYQKMQLSENTRIADVAPVLVNASKGYAWGLSGAQSRVGRSSALPWAPAACTQARVRTGHRHVFGTVPFWESFVTAS